MNCAASSTCAPRPMTEVARVVVDVAAAVASRDATALEQALKAAEAAGAGEAVDEVLLQSVLFVGYPLGLEALAAWRRVSTNPPPLPTQEDPRLWAERGARVCRAVYGSQYDRLRDNIRGLHADAERWMLVDGYGRVLGRGGLDLATRELAIVAQLTVLGTHRQLYSHARGALNVGALAADVEAAIAAAAPYISSEDMAAATDVWSDVRARRRLASQD